jgi:hypothetical protein
MRAAERSDFPEFELLLACLRWPQPFVDGEKIQRLAASDLRWPYLLEMVHHHKVAPLFFRNLQTFAGRPLAAASLSLEAHYKANAALCQHQANHLRVIAEEFRQQHIDVRVFKGIPLGLAAYQDACLRDAGDIDLLIAEKDIFAAEATLLGLGYQRSEPKARLTPRRFRSYLSHHKDFAYEHTAYGLDLDLHWRLFRNPYLPSNAALAQVGQAWQPVENESMPTLPTPRLLLYLCVHGALDGWLRLKWLADVSALLRTIAPADLRESLHLARQEQALPAFSAACILSHQLLGNDVPAGCLDADHPEVARILRFSRKAMASNNYRPLREQIPSSAWFWNELRLHSSLRYRLNLLGRFLFRPRAWRNLDLPDAIFPLYALWSPIEWLSFHLRRRFGRWRRMLRPPADVGLAIEAGCMLTFFRIALKFLPVQKLTAWMSRGNGKQTFPNPEGAAQIMRRVEWSIDAVVRHAPIDFVCFPQCLAAYFMLRRRHVASRLFYGIAREANQLKAHTWVKVGDRTIVGGNVESQFTVLTTFP